MKVIRNSAKAVIIRDGKLLTIKNTTDGQNWYILPGGGQDHNESLIDALRRECMEEASIQIEVGDILFVRDYISKNHEFAETENDAHQVEFMFNCTIAEDAEPEMGDYADQWQTGVQWLPLKTLSDFALYPSVLREAISEGIPERASVYLGDVN